MEPIRFIDLKNCTTSHKTQLSDGQREVLQLFYDSRTILNGSGGVFFALKSQRQDGHNFIPEVWEKGVSQWVISNEHWANWLNEKGEQNWILVPDVLSALQELAIWKRKKIEVPVVGITGSNGKTIVKEWLAQLIGPDKIICKSPGSFNSQIGVPISVWKLNATHDLGIFEAGVSRKGEMARLASIIQPTIGIFTHLGAAHAEGFGSEDEKLREKLILFSRSSTIICAQKWADRIKSALGHTATELLAWQWQKADKNWQLDFEGQQYSFELPFWDEASLENLGNAISACLYFQLSPNVIQERIAHLQQPEMRLSLKEGINENLLVDDSYTNDLSGLEAALQFAALQRKPNQNLSLILSDFEGAEGIENYLNEQIKNLLTTFRVDHIYTIGSQFEKTADLRYWRNYPNTESFLNNSGIAHIQHQVIVIKGARKFHFEQIPQHLQKKIHGTRLEINLEALVSNLNFYRSLLPAKTRIMAMVKALGYGSGGEEVARILQYHKVDYLAVAYADEGIYLREKGITVPIMVLNPMPEVFDLLIRYNLEPEIYSSDLLKEWIRISENKVLPPIHIKLDTGMHRLGFMAHEVPNLLDMLLSNRQIRIASIFSHLAGADEADLEDFTRSQLSQFENLSKTITSQFPFPILRHVLNSAGIVRYPEATYDMVRLGIGLYGIEVNAWYQNQLLPVSSLRTTISQVKFLEPPETVGYGRQGKLSGPSTIATIAIGYADGFRRAFSKGKVRVKVKGTWVPTIGNVCMDMTMINCTGLDVAEGDEVVIFDDAKSLLSLSQAAETIPYEILTGIGQRVKRIFFK